ncbi:hypothetical protein ACLMJK_008909 [Lecanora helva]
MSINVVFYHYTPSLALAIIFAVLFAAITVYHLIQMVRYRASFMLPVVVGGIFEIIAYIGRTISHSSPRSLTPFVIQAVLSLVAPALFAATIYMTFGRIVCLLHAQQYSLIGINKLTSIFVSFDVLSFLIQSSGGGLQAAKNHSATRLGRVLVLVALLIQILAFGLFVLVAAICHSQILTRPTRRSKQLPWKRHMLGLYIASGLILLRNAVRVVEYVQGYDGYIQHREWFLYVFDAAPMFCVMVVMAIIYAPSLFKQQRAGGPGEAELGERTRG